MGKKICEGTEGIDDLFRASGDPAMVFHGPLTSSALWPGLNTALQMRKKFVRHEVRVPALATEPGLARVVTTPSSLRSGVVTVGFDDGVGRLPMDGHTGQRPQRLCERTGEGQCRRGYCALRGLPCQAGAEAAGGRAVAGSAEILVIVTLKNHFDFPGGARVRIAENHPGRADIAGVGGVRRASSVS